MPPVDRNNPVRAKSSDSRISFMEFMREFPDDAACLDYLWRTRYAEDGENAECPKCEQVRPFNLIVSNVPGPNIPLYLAGVPLQAYYPVSAIADGQGLNITVLGYLGQLHFGVLACRELVPDVDKIATYLADELSALCSGASQSSTTEAVQSGASS